MAFLPIEHGITNNCLPNLRLIATDMDGTLTQQGKFTAKLLQSLEELRAADIPVLIVTGRSGGWVSGLLTLPGLKTRGFFNQRANLLMQGFDKLSPTRVEVDSPKALLMSSMKVPVCPTVPNP